jgi:UTP:GlnB (protein PII) uridylyltransferase
MTDFLDTMPAAYARLFTTAEAREHAAIVVRRGAQLAHAEMCAGRDGGRVCVVADDRPGLLALVTDALLVHGLSIRSAQVYCRTRADGMAEAVDLFQLQRPEPSHEDLEISSAELKEFVQTLSELIAEDVLASSRPSAASQPGRAPTRVYFELDALRRGEAVLLVDAPDSQGLLNAITNALHDQGMRILASEVQTVGNMAHDRFDLASGDDVPLNAIRLCDIQQAVHAALPSAARR